MIHALTEYHPTHVRAPLRIDSVVALDKANDISNRLWIASLGGDVQIVLMMAYKGWLFKENR